MSSRMNCGIPDGAAGAILALRDGSSARWTENGEVAGDGGAARSTANRRSACGVLSVLPKRRLVFGTTAVEERAIGVSQIYHEVAVMFAGLSKVGEGVTGWDCELRAGVECARSLRQAGRQAASNGQTEMWGNSRSGGDTTTLLRLSGRKRAAGTIGACYYAIGKKYRTQIPKRMN